MIYYSHTYSGDRNDKTIRNKTIQLLHPHFLAASIIAIEFVIDINSIENLSVLCNTQSTENSQYLCESLHNIRNKIIIMLGTLTIVVAIIMLMFIKNISNPLKRISKAAEKINNGDLSQVIPIETQDEIGQVGKAINELTSNLQEVTALTSVTVSQLMKEIDLLSEQSKNNKPITESDINNMKDHLNTLNDFVNAFELLETDINK